MVENHYPEAPLGVVHGRFQVLHNDHLKYIFAAKQRCRELVIAITNPDPHMTLSESADIHRSSSLANPLTYYERYQLVRAAMQASGQDAGTYSIVPLPISMPNRYQYYVPLDALFFLTIYDDWGRRKKHYFNTLGLKVEILWDAPKEKKGISGAQVRERMCHCLPWESMVPPAVADLLKKWDIPKRLREIKDSL